MSGILTVSQLNRYISFRLKEDKNLLGILIGGEISNFVNHAKTGHFYFTLKDGECSVKAVMFAGMASRLNFIPFSGMKVIISADVKVFERDGIYQLYVNDIQPDGIGALYYAVEQLKEKLLKEGFFDEANKKLLPAFPVKIAVVTSPDGAALHDILNILSRRYPIAKVIVFPCLVQGENAPCDICRALKKADKAGCDIIILGRGGGSFEDLMAFNSEPAARAVFDCETPVISAVGHETDNSVTDLVADLRAPTPSAAAELAVPDIAAVEGYLNSAAKELTASVQSKIENLRQIISKREILLLKSKPAGKFLLIRSEIRERERKLEYAFRAKLNLFGAVIAEKSAFLSGLSPLNILSRGYSLIYKDKKLIKSSEELKKGDIITVTFSDGDITASVI